MKRILPLLIAFEMNITLILPIAALAAQSPEERYDIGMAYYNGDGVEQDYEHAFSYFLIAGEIEQYPPAMNMLGICYRDGKGTDQDTDQAMNCFQRAASLGSSDAEKNLQELQASLEEGNPGSDKTGVSQQETGDTVTFGTIDFTYSSSSIDCGEIAGHEGGAGIRSLKEPVENCISLNYQLGISNLSKGNVFGEWGFYIRDLEGNWKLTNTFNVNSLSISERIIFDAPMSFDAFAVHCHCLGDEWSFNYSESLTDAVAIVEAEQTISEKQYIPAGSSTAVIPLSSFSSGIRRGSVKNAEYYHTSQTVKCYASFDPANNIIEYKNAFYYDSKGYNICVKVSNVKNVWDGPLAWGKNYKSADGYLALSVGRVDHDSGLISGTSFDWELWIEDSAWNRIDINDLLVGTTLNADAEYTNIYSCSDALYTNIPEKKLVYYGNSRVFSGWNIRGYDSPDYYLLGLLKNGENARGTYQITSSAFGGCEIVIGVQK